MKVNVFSHVTMYISRHKKRNANDSEDFAIKVWYWYWYWCK